MPSQPLPTSQVAWQLASPSAPMETKMRLNQTAPVPSLKANQTLVRVLAASINPADYKIAEIGFPARLMTGWPHTPGQDYVGRVWSTTLPAEKGIKPGDLVFGNHKGPNTYGSLAQFTLVPGDDTIAQVPDLSSTQGVNIDEFAALGVAAGTAHQVLIPALGKGEGQGRGKSVFINGGSGGVGTYCIQIAKNVLECDHVVVTCSGANAELCRSLGADEVIDYRTQDAIKALPAWCEKNGRKFDLVVDNVLSDPRLYWECGKYLAAGANYVQIGGTPSWSLAWTVIKMMLWPTFLGGAERKFLPTVQSNSHAKFEDLGRWVQQGKVKPMVDSTYSMEDVPQAFKRLKTERTTGKMVIKVNDEGRNES